ncbi:hypothetical protein [Methylobrevis pamukkalensis]|uniref:Apolipoprotein A1/A4/E domain protein n=1 Tax=Methylobrevis pamukkalensis TaxID=1439726 RepID=A0A1E3H3L8_9HYPH|nr:hypothetical protein [Methylobrevis pamukkalensis]ODN70745.1 Apolipoprotein A1/A4/E domain protein [Methylobrevis pamukkalensis]
MANKTTKTDAAELALSAVEEALKLDFGLDDDKPAPAAETGADPAPAPAEPRKDDRAGPRAARTRPKAPANDDRRAVGTLLYQLQRRPSSSVFWVAFAVSVVWLAAIGYVGLSLIGGNLATGDVAALARRPDVLVVATLAIIPVMFFWTMALMIWRAQEMRLTSRTMTEVALRLAEPEDVARESVITVGQAIRREVAAMGDGIERALARASELEVLVHNEVSSLERSYTENEIRIRSLIEELVNQRESVVSNAERVRSSISGAHEALTSEMRNAGELITGRLEETGRDLTRTFGEKAEQLTIAFDSAGRNLTSAVSESGEEFVARLETSGRDISDRIANVGLEVDSRISASSNEVTGTITRVADETAARFASESERLTGAIAATGESVTGRLETTTRDLLDRLTATGEDLTGTVTRTLGETIATFTSEAAPSPTASP